MSTKILAKKLGLIRKRNNISDDTPRSSASGQRFNFLIIIDFESTCWREKKFSPEIIEFPAVLLDVSNGQIRSEFHTYIQPQEHLVLSSFCRELTGITQEQVDSSPPFHVCLSQFNRWMEMLERENGVVFETDSTSPDHNCAFVTWSDWDLGVCLLYECKRKQIRVPEPLKSWIDLRATYRLFYNRKPKGLRGALLDLGLQFSGREHSGLVDARNTALLALRMMSDGCMLNVTKSLRQTGAKCKRVKCDRLSAKVCEQSNPHTDVDNGSVQVCVDGSGSLAGLSDTTYDPEALDICWREEEESRSYDDVVLEAGPNDITTWLCGPSGLEETHSSASTAEPQRPEHSRRSHSGPHSFKITSPLCKCGRRTRLLTASRAGPNNGRAFYCCSSSKKRCSFFMWESVLLNRIRTTRSV